MSTTRILRAVTIATALVVGASGVTAAAVAPHRSTATVPDGEYVGYVWRPPRDDTKVAIDVVSVRGCTTAMDVVVDAGLLADAGVLSDRPQPFRVTVTSGAIVSLVSADDAVADGSCDRPTASDGVEGAPRWTATDRVEELHA